MDNGGIFKEMDVKLQRALPPNRSLEQLKNHYTVEKAIAQKLKQGNREERKLLYAIMYDKLFNQVPDHPRLTQRADENLTQMANNSKFELIKSYLNKSMTFVEFAPGDCRFAMEVAKYVQWVYGVDISDQRSKALSSPDNFKLILYNGYDLEAIEEASVDMVFSDQLIEHLHPEDTTFHFQLVHRILKENGKYIFITPHAFTGPHDVSKYFSDEPEGFHLKEWSYAEIEQLLKKVGYSGFYFNHPFNAYLANRHIKIRLPHIYYTLCERLLGLFPKSFIRGAADKLTPSICGVAVK